jgi:ubiquinone/menaquinone biosynthesis C-methylase UbiE
MKKRSHRFEKMARVYDDEILPIWSQRFGRMLLRDLDLPKKAMVLDVGCGTGYPALELIKRMDGLGRIIAIDPIGPLLDVARKKAGDMAGKRIFFRSEPPVAKLAFADDVYDLVISNLGLLLLDDAARAAKEFARVTKPGGRVLVTIPLAGTYNEFYDIYREVLTKNDQEEVLVRLEQHIARTPDAERAARWFEDAGLGSIDIEVEQFSLLFKSSREFFFAPLIEFGPLAEWKDIAGKGQEMQEIFWHIKEAIDAYFANRAFEITVKAGCFRATKPVAASGEAATRRAAEAGPPSAPIARRVTGPHRALERISLPESFADEKDFKDDFKLDDEEEPSQD